MQIAVKDGMVYVRNYTDAEYKVTESWGLLRYVKKTKWMQGTVNLDILDGLASLMYPQPLQKRTAGSFRKSFRKLFQVMTTWTSRGTRHPQGAPEKRKQGGEQDGKERSSSV